MSCKTLTSGCIFLDRQILLLTLQHHTQQREVLHLQTHPLTLQLNIQRDERKNDLLSIYWLTLTGFSVAVLVGEAVA